MMMIFHTLLVLTLAAGGLAEESRSLASGVWGAWKSKRVKVLLAKHGPGLSIESSCDCPTSATRRPPQRGRFFLQAHIPVWSQ